MTLFDLEEIEDEIKDYKVSTGDLWACGNHRVVCGDCTDKKNVELLFKDKKANLIFSDPPYNVEYGEAMHRINVVFGRNMKNREIKNDKMDNAQFTEFISKFLANVKPYLEKYNSYYICCSSSFIDLFITALRENDYIYSSMIIWAKNQPVLNFSDYMTKHEPILYGWYKKHKFYKGAGCFRHSIWEIDKPQKSPYHPTQKPLELVSNAILNSTQEDMIVYDGFLGSGTTLLACEKIKRACYGIELETKYVNIILNRYRILTGKEPEKLN